MDTSGLANQLWFDLIGLVGRLFTNGSEDQSSTQVESYQRLGEKKKKKKKMVLDTSLLNTQHYKGMYQG